MIEAFATMGVQRYRELQEIASQDTNDEATRALRCALREINALREEAREQTQRVNAARKAIAEAARAL